MQKPEPFGLSDEGLPIFLRQHLPSSTEGFGNLGVVHVGRHLGDLASLDLRPDHEGVHGPLDVVRRLRRFSPSICFTLRHFLWMSFFVTRNFFMRGAIEGTKSALMQFFQRASPRERRNVSSRRIRNDTSDTCTTSVSDCALKRIKPSSIGKGKIDIGKVFSSSFVRVNGNVSLIRIAFCTDDRIPIHYIRLNYE